MVGGGVHPGLVDQFVSDLGSDIIVAAAIKGNSQIPAPVGKDGVTTDHVVRRPAEIDGHAILKIARDQICRADRCAAQEIRDRT